MTKQELATLTEALAKLTNRFDQLEARIVGDEDLSARATAVMPAYGDSGLGSPLAEDAAESEHRAVYNALFEAIDVPLPASEEHRQAYSYALHTRLFDVRIFLLRALGEYPDDKPLSPEERLAALRHSTAKPPPVWYLIADYESDANDDQSLYVAENRATA